MVSFLILSSLILPLIQCNILISATLTWLSCWFLTAQHSVPYHIAGLTAVRYNLRLFSISTTQLEYDDLHLLLFLRYFVLWSQSFCIKPSIHQPQSNHPCRMVASPPSIPVSATMYNGLPYCTDLHHWSHGGVLRTTEE